jgi:hypothetical protein
MALLSCHRILITGNKASMRVTVFYNDLKCNNRRKYAQYFDALGKELNLIENPSRLHISMLSTLVFYIITVPEQIAEKIVHN